MEPNSIETQIIKWRAKEIDFNILLNDLLNTKVYLIVDKEALPTEDGKIPPYNPYLVKNAEGNKYVMVFTSAERTESRITPQFKYLIYTNFGWIMENSKFGYGILINNPGDYCVEIMPNTADIIRKQLIKLSETSHKNDNNKE